MHLRWHAAPIGKRRQHRQLHTQSVRIEERGSAPVARNEAPVEPSAPKAKSATSKPKHPAVTGAHPTKLRSQLANSKTATEVPKPSPKRQASAEPEPARDPDAPLA